MPTILHSLTHRWKGSPYIYVPYLAAMLLQVAILRVVWDDFIQSVEGVYSFPVNIGSEWFVFALSAMFQLVTIVFGYAVAAAEMEARLKYALISVIAVCVTVDTATNIAFLYDGTGWVSMVTSTILSFSVFTLFSEFAVVFNTGFLVALFPDFKEQIGRDLSKRRGRKGSGQQQQRDRQPEAPPLLRQSQGGGRRDRG